MHLLKTINRKKITNKDAIAKKKKVSLQKKNRALLSGLWRGLRTLPHTTVKIPRRFSFFYFIFVNITKSILLILIVNLEKHRELFTSLASPLHCLSRVIIWRPFCFEGGYIVFVVPPLTWSTQVHTSILILV
jgi:hypothetical protein